MIKLIIFIAVSTMNSLEGMAITYLILLRVTKESESRLVVNLAYSFCKNSYLKMGILEETNINLTRIPTFSRNSGWNSKQFANQKE